MRKIVETDLPRSLALGVLGLNGVTALLALTLIGEPKPGDHVLVSTAAGSVGSAVGQIAKILGCRTIGIAGGAQKVAQCLNLFGYDAAIDYKAPALAEALDAACPNGVQVYFDNTAGAISDAVYPRLAVGARVVICGTASIASWDPWPTGPRVERHLLVKRARVQGFVIFDHMARYEASVATLAGWVRAGQLRYEEDILDGLESCPDALAGLYRGENKGKRLIRL
jgi:NADPH-dependent curcumin reductase CurA